DGDKKHDAMQNMASRPQSLQDYLNDQLSFLDGTPREQKLRRYVISHIDENGYLKPPLGADGAQVAPAALVEELIKDFGEPVTAEEVEAATRMVQKLEPPGVGARDLRECLLLQLTPETPHREVLRVLIQNHLEDLQHNRLPVIQRKTGFD